MDISDINHKEISLDFSVQEVLNHNEYCLNSPKISTRNKCKPTPRANKNVKK